MYLSRLVLASSIAMLRLYLVLVDNSGGKLANIHKEREESVQIGYVSVLAS